MASAMPIRQDLHGHYLSLALDARRIIDELLQLAESGQGSSAWQETLSDVVASLETAADVPQPTTSRFVFSHYEQIRTLDEVKKPEERAALTEKLKKLESHAFSQNDSKSSLYDAIDFFTNVESRALYHYRRRPGAWASASA
ncbi:MAG: hypothetical protein ABSC23_10295 [Bryobacteraceae bacterium]|jgi:hypothetical protein